MSRRLQPPPSRPLTPEQREARARARLAALDPCPDCAERYTDAHWFAVHAPAFLLPGGVRPARVEGTFGVGMDYLVTSSRDTRAALEILGASFADLTDKMALASSSHGTLSAPPLESEKG